MPWIITALLIIILGLVLMTSDTEEEVGVWAWTADYDLIVVETMDGLAYGCQNRHTGVVEVIDSVFANSVGHMIDLQYSYEAVEGMILSDGELTYDSVQPVKEKKEFH